MSLNIKTGICPYCSCPIYDNEQCSCQKMIFELLTKPAKETTQDKISIVCKNIEKILLHKNKKYGNSALEPLGIFAKNLTAEDGIKQRLDDKLKRIQMTPIDKSFAKNDLHDLIGYLVLLIVSYNYLDIEDLLD